MISVCIEVDQSLSSTRNLPILSRTHELNGPQRGKGEVVSHV